MLLEVLQFDDPILFTPAVKIEEFNSTVMKLASDMKETMIHYNGIGITGCQVGQPLALMIVYDPSTRINYTMCNPEIVEAHGSQIDKEGCLSSKGQYIELERPDIVVVKYQTIFGKDVTVGLKGIGARCAVHEFLHILGYNPLKTVELPFSWEK